MANRITDGGMGYHLYPAVTARRGCHRAHSGAGPDRVNFVYAYRVGGTNDRRDIMRFVNLFHADRQVRLTPGEHLTNTRITL